MYCTKCGAPIAEGAQSCAACGAPAGSVTGQQRQKLSKKAMLIGIAAVVLLAVLLALLLPKPVTLDLAKLYDINFRGVSGRGYMAIDFNEEECFRLGDKLEKKGDEALLDKVEILLRSGAGYGANGDMSPVPPENDHYLSNGDKVTIEIAYDEEMCKKAGVRIRNAKQKLTVEGLKEPISVDAYAYAELQFHGVNGRGSVSLAWDTDGMAAAGLSEMQIELIKSLVIYCHEGTASSLDTLENGDVLDVYLSVKKPDPIGEDHYLEQGILFTRLNNTYTVEGLTEARAVDPFAGLQMVVSGISPFAEVSFDNSKCDPFVQQYVTFKPSQETARNGDKVTVRAECDDDALNEQAVALSVEEKAFTVSGAAEFLTDLAGVELAGIHKEFNDMYDVASGKWNGGILNSNIMGLGTYDMDGQGSLGNNSPELIASENVENHLCWRKPQSESKKENYNKYLEIYKVTYRYKIDDKQCQQALYLCINMYDLRKYPDGRVEFEPKMDWKAYLKYEDAVYEQLTKLRDEYNVTDIATR